MVILVGLILGVLVLCLWLSGTVIGAVIAFLPITLVALILMLGASDRHPDIGTDIIALVGAIIVTALPAMIRHSSARQKRLLLLRQ